MKRILISILIFLGLGLGGAVVASSLIRGKTMALAEVKKKWGEMKFDAETFKNGKSEIRSKMSYSLLNDEKSWIGKDVDEVRKTLGPPDGFYQFDINPAYIIQEGQKRGDETWQIVFLLNNQYKVRKMIMHLNCCEK